MSKSADNIAARYAEVGFDDGDTGTSLERDLRMVKDNMKKIKL